MLAKESGNFEDEGDEGDEEGEEGEEDENAVLPRPRKSRKVTDSINEEADAPAEEDEHDGAPSCAKDILHLEDSEDEGRPPLAADDLEDLEGASPTPVLQQNHEVSISSCLTLS